jgi:hypothetical protein
MTQKAFTGTIVSKRDVTVFAESAEEAEKTIKALHESGDACAELGDAEVTNVRETDEDGNEFFNVYLFFDDQSATLVNVPVLKVPENTTELTDEMVRAILKWFLESLHDGSGTKYIPLLENWDRDKMADAMWALCTVLLNRAAIVHPKHEDYLRKYGEELFKDFGGDTSTYRACRSFSETLKSLSLRVVSFPFSDLDEAEDRDYNQ